MTFEIKDLSVSSTSLSSLTQEVTTIYTVVGLLTSISLLQDIFIEIIVQEILGLTSYVFLKTCLISLVMSTQIFLAKDKIPNTASLFYKYVYKIHFSFSNLPDNKHCDLPSKPIMNQ